MAELVMVKFLILAFIITVVVFGFAYKMNVDTKAKQEALAQQIQQQKDDQVKHEIEKQKNIEIEKKQALQVIEAEKKSELVEIKKIENLVKDQLIDPDSATFKNQKSICGEVNAKNKFGGYIGFKKYIYMSESNTVAIEGGDKDIYSPDVMQMLWDKAC